MDSPGGTPPARRGHLSWPKRLIFTLLTAALVFAVVEGVSRILIESTSNPRWKYHHGLLVDLGCPQLNELLEPDPQRFWRLRPSLDDVLVSGSVGGSAHFRFRVSTDEWGLRRTPPVVEPSRRVLMLGDSCLFGLGVDDDETVAAHLQEMLAGVECVNAGVPGYTSYQARRWLDELARRGPFDAVVLNFGRNDGLRWNDRGDPEQAEMMARQRSAMEERLRVVRLVRGLSSGDSQTKSAQAEGERKRPRMTDAEFAVAMTALGEWAESMGADPIFLVWPVVQQMRRSGLDTKQHTTLALAARRGWRVVDLITPLRRGGGPDLFLDVVHANPQGCRVVAEALVEPLRTALAH